MNEYLQREYMDNRLLDYLIALGIIIVGTMAVQIMKKVVLARLHRWASSTENSADDFVIRSVERFGVPAIHYFVVYSGLNYLNLSAKAQNVISIATSVVITYLLIRLISTTILHLLQGYIRKQERGEEKVKQLGGLMILVNMVIWILGIIYLMDNLGHDVTALVAGLGIGGIAIALAAQNILGDLFNYFVIFFDRPFEVGDFIIVDDKLGTIEYIGLKTTRIRSLTGEQLVIGNANLTNSRIHNYKRMGRRRIVFSVDVEYGTPLEIVRELPGFFRSTIEQNEKATFDRAHFAKFADSSLRYEMVYWVESPEFNTYMEIQQKINFAIYEEFTRRGIGFAFPSTSVYLNANNKLQKTLNTLVDRTGGRNGAE